MSLDLSDVDRIAQLAQLEVSDSQKQKTATQLNDILALVEQLRQVDTTGVEPLAHPISAFEDASGPKAQGRRGYRRKPSFRIIRPMCPCR